MKMLVYRFKYQYVPRINGFFPNNLFVLLSCFLLVFIRKLVDIKKNFTKKIRHLFTERSQIGTVQPVV